MQNLDKQFPFINKIKDGAHGHGKYQKRYWKVVSDTVRIRDFYKYGTCIACGRRVGSWQDLQAGHYKAWAVCKGFSKWDQKNIFGECGICNTGFNGNETGVKFKEGIIKRYGKKRMDYIDMLSKYPSEKMDDFKCCLMIKEVLKEMKDLPEQPEYWYQCREWLGLQPGWSRRGFYVKNDISLLKAKNHPQRWPFVIYNLKESFIFGNSQKVSQDKPAYQS